MPWRMPSSSDREPLKRLWKEDRQKNNRVTNFAAFVDAIFTAIWNVWFWWAIYLRSPNERKWKNVAWPIWPRNLIFAFGFKECFAKQNTEYIKLFPKAAGRIARTSTLARSDCKASICSGSGPRLQENRDKQSCKTLSTLASQQHNQHLRRIYRREYQFSNSSLFSRMHCI